MPRLHLASSASTKGPGSALGGVQNLQPRAPRRSLSPPTTTTITTTNTSTTTASSTSSSSSAANGENSTTVNNNNGRASGNAISDLDLFDFDEFDYNEIINDSNSSVLLRDHGRGGSEVQDVSGINSNVMKKSSAPSSKPKDNRTNRPLSKLKKQSLALSPLSISSSSSSNGMETLAELSRRSKKTNGNCGVRSRGNNQAGKKRKNTRDSISPVGVGRLVPTVSSRKITVASIAHDSHTDSSSDNSGENVPKKKRATSKKNTKNSATAKKYTNQNQNDENSINESTASKNIITTKAAPKGKKSAHSRKKNSLTNQQQHRQQQQQQKQKKAVSFDKQTNDKKATVGVKKANASAKSTSGKNGKVGSGKKIKKCNASGSKSTKSNKSLDYFDTDSETDGSNDDDDSGDELQDTDDEEEEEQQQLEKKVISASKPTPKINTNHNNRRHQETRNNDHEGSKTQVLPLRAIVIDNRALPTFVGDAMARYSFLSHIPQFVKEAVEKGVYSSSSSGSASFGLGSTIVASLTHGSKKHSLGDGLVSESGANSDKSASAMGTTDEDGMMFSGGVSAHAAFLLEARGEAPAASRDLKKQEVSSWLSGFVAPINHGFGSEVGGNQVRSNNGNNADMDGIDYESVNEVNRRVPDGFSARSSWDYFGDLVEEVEGKLSCSAMEPNNGCRNQRPYSITLFTTDTALFADANSMSHKNGLDRFWARISSLFRSNMVSNITIMIVETSNVTQMMKVLKNIPNGDTSSSLFPSQSEDMTDEYFRNMSEDESLHSSSNRLEVIRCVNNIRQRIHELSEAQVETTSTTSIDLRLDFMEGGSVSFQNLLQQFVKESFAQSYASSSRRVHGRLSFDLPEDLDGNMCSISLDLQYTALPYSIGSQRTLHLVEDMQQISSMSQSSLKVLQVMPLTSVDSSLIYGVPMSARAGLENDLTRYNEMKLLVRQLWKYLGRNDLALVLRYRRGDGGEEADTEEDFKDEPQGVPEEQLFLLVSESAVQKPSPTLNDANLDMSDAQNIVPDETRKGEAPCHGILYRYATKNQILHFGSEDPSLEAEEVNEDSAEMSDEIYDCIERSLDLYVKGGLNPLLN